MGLDIDYVAAKHSLQELQKVLDSLPHGQRSDIADDYDLFAEKMKAKYRKLEKVSTDEEDEG